MAACHGRELRVVSCFDRLSMTTLKVVELAGAIVLEGDVKPGRSSPVMLSLSKHDDGDRRRWQ